MINEHPEWLKNFICRDRVVTISASIDSLLEHPSKDAVVKKYGDFLKRLTHERRRNDFIAGRVALHLLCQKLGQDVPMINVDHQGMPIFPAPLKGSLSHSNGNLIGMMTSDPDIHSLGVDLESLVTSDRAERLHHKIGNVDEFNRLAKLYTTDVAFTILFAAKEALFKAVYPLVKSMFWFEDAVLIGTQTEDNKLRFQLDSRICKCNPTVKHVVVEWARTDHAIVCTCMVAPTTFA